MNIIRSNTWTKTFKAKGDYSAKTIEFALKATKNISDSILILKSSLTGGLTRAYANGYTTFTVTLTESDTSDLSSGTYFYDITCIETNKRTTLEGPLPIQIIADVNNPLSGTSLTESGTRNIVLDGRDATDGQIPVCRVIGGVRTFPFETPTSPVLYKTYRAILTQEETAAPVVVEQENSVGEIVWERSSAGVYITTSLTGINTNKIYAAIQQAPTGTQSISIEVFSQYLRIKSGVLSFNPMNSQFTSTGEDNLLNNTRVEILVYP